MKKEWIAGALSLALLAGSFPASAASFPDVTDPETSQATEVLRQLGVISGLPDGTYNPSGSFTRAEFCKMALTILGRESEAALQKGRVIFSDVTGSHWALGYINAAASVPDQEGATALVQGKGDGTFAPCDPITVGEAVAILIRSLGYSDKDVAMAGAWYAGHMEKARTIGLLEGLEELKGDGVLHRGEAAELFENILFVKGKNASDVFFVSTLEGKITKSQLILDVKGKALSGGGYALKTSEGTYKTYREDFSEELQGETCSLVLDREGNVLALLRDENYTTRRVRVIAAEGRYLLTQDQEQILVASSTPVWRENAAEGTYGDLYAKEIPYGATAVLCYDDTDTLASIYLLGNSDSTITAVVDADGKLKGVVPDENVAVYRNGLTASLSALRPYDVVSYDAAAGVLTVTDNKLTGIYENATPSPVSPNKITLMGCEFTVLDSALASLAGFKLGDAITLLLDHNNQVAAVVSSKTVEVKALGVATFREKPSSESKERDGYEVEVTLGNGLVLSGKAATSITGAEQAPGRLVEVYATEMGKLKLSRVEENTAPGSWNVAKGTLGNLTVSPQAAIYEKVGNSALVLLESKEVTVSTVAAGKIRYYHQDASGAVDCLVLEDVTGQGYTYGVVTEYITGSSDSDNMYNFSNPQVTLQNGKSKVTLVCSTDMSKYKGKYLGFAASLSEAQGVPRVSSLVTLQNAGSVRRNAFGEDSVMVAGKSYPLDSRIDQLCYNAKSKTWFGSLEEALAYSSRLSVYCDKSPDQGGKIRLVVVE